MQVDAILTVFISKADEEINKLLHLYDLNRTASFLLFIRVIDRASPGTDDSPVSITAYYRRYSEEDTEELSLVNVS